MLALRLLTLTLLVALLISCGGAATDENSNQQLPKLRTLGTISQAIDFSGDLILMGEVVNTGSTAIFVKARCNLFDLNGDLLETKTTYVIGSVVVLKPIQINTNTALRQGEVGVFKAWTDTPAASVKSFECTYTFDVGDVEEPQANLQIEGDVNKQEDVFGDLELLGSVTNTGTKDLTFGQVIFAIKDNTSKILDIDSTYIDGETVLLRIGVTTDTALSAGNTGTFDVTTNVAFSSADSFDPYFDWNDAIIQSGIVLERSRRTYTDNKKQFWEERDRRIDQIRQLLY